MVELGCAESLITGKGSYAEPSHRNVLIPLGNGMVFVAYVMHHIHLHYPYRGGGFGVVVEYIPEGRKAIGSLLIPTEAHCTLQH